MRMLLPPRSRIPHRRTRFGAAAGHVAEFDNDMRYIGGARVMLVIVFTLVAALLTKERFTPRCPQTRANSAGHQTSEAAGTNIWSSLRRYDLAIVFILDTIEALDAPSAALLLFSSLVNRSKGRHASTSHACNPRRTFSGA
jgi:hypothetical protein